MMLPTVGCGLASSDKRDLAIGVRNAAGPIVCVLHDSNKTGDGCYVAGDAGMVG